MTCRYYPSGASDYIHVRIVRMPIGTETCPMVVTVGQIEGAYPADPRYLESAMTEAEYKEHLTELAEAWLQERQKDAKYLEEEQ